MKNFLMLLLLIILASCQKEELTIVESQEENSFLQDLQLTNLIKAVASHDGSFDDIVDRSSCFSINFPYQVNYNNEVISINSINDLNYLDPNISVRPIMPISISLADYSEVAINSLDTYFEYINKCELGELYNNRIVCTDFIYPIEIATFDKDSNIFETLTIGHDKDNFTSISSFENNILASFNFPIVLFDENGNSTSIIDNQKLKSFLQTIAAACD